MVVALAGCGGSSGHTSRGGRSLAGVGTCLQSAGYGVTVVPASQIVQGGAENRGPGETGELLVGRNGVKPVIGDDGDAIVAFWKTAKLAKSSPNAQTNGLATHAYPLGTVTVQPTAQLVSYAVKAAKAPSAREAAYNAQLKKIEGCVG